MPRRKRPQFLFVVFSLLLLLLLSGYGDANAQPEAKRDSNVTIRGRVVDENGNPVAGAEVGPASYHRFPERPTAETDANGVFQLTLDSKKLDSTINFCAMTSDRSLLGDSWLRYNTGVAEIPELEIIVEPCPSITGTVVDQNGKPVEGATVDVVSGNAGYLNTDAEGKFKTFYDNRYRYSPCPSAIYAYKEGTGFDYLSNEDISEQVGFKSFETESREDFKDLSVQLMLSPGTPVRFKVVNEEGEPLPGVKIFASEIPQKGQSRNWPFGVAPTSSLESFIDALGAADSCYGLTNEEGIATVKFLPERFIMQAWFSADCPKEGVLHSDGRRVHYGGWRHRTLKELLEEREIPTFTLRKWDREERKPPVPVTGTVKLPDGTPVPWIKIEIETAVDHHHSWIPSAFTDVNGEYETRPLFHDDKYHIRVADNMIGIAPRVLNVDVGNGDTETTIDFVLKKGIRVHGTVYGVDGKPLSDLERPGRSSSRLYSDYNVTILEKKPKSEPKPPESPFLDDEENEGDIWDVWNNERNRYRAGIFDGKYECLLPALKGEYTIEVSGGGYGRHINAVRQEFTLNGDEEEFELDLYVSEKENENMSGGYGSTN